ncbi:short chain dehydrogenase/reductase [Rhodococcus triatomae BKS 15-14]|nr:short chain dehydrogenase/reductase [Rhodococcus triatomae BKS 15-14]
MSTALAEAGAHVVCADLSAEAASAVASAIPKSDAIQLDVTDPMAVTEAADAVAGRLGRIDVWCNLAGIAGTSQRVSDITDEAFERIFNVHFRGTLHGCRAALGVMRPRGRGAIVNMSSEAIDIHPATVGSYAVSKAAIGMLTRVLAAEVGTHGIRVNAVAPSFVPSELSLGHHTDEAERESYLQWWRRKSPLGDLCAADDIAAQIVYLASSASQFVTGQTLRTNGGISMPW